jgi:hypothetical protein
VSLKQGKQSKKMGEAKYLLTFVDLKAAKKFEKAARQQAAKLNVSR